MAQIVELRAANEVAAVDAGTATRDERGERAPRVQGVAPLLDYGDNVLPWDRWFGTLHDGTEESRQRMRRTRRLPTAKGLV